MGIRGLKSFIENNKDLLSGYELHDTWLVIDGSNLFNALYTSCSVDSKDYIYGGDYGRFADCCHQFFKSLQRCRIQAVVVFDGGIDPSQQKMKTVVKRFKCRLDTAKCISKGNLIGDRILPILCRQVMHTVMTDLDVHLIQALYEADSLIACIANQLKCPVLSNDSDFFVFDLKFGVISVDCLLSSYKLERIGYNIIDNTKTYNYLDCDIYLIDNLIDYFPGLKRECLPLFSTLMGNDWVDCNVFDNIFSIIPNVETLSRNKRKSLHVGKRHQRMVKLLSWLREKTVDDSVTFLINFLKKSSRNKAMDLLQISLENYANGVITNDLKNIDFSDMSSFLPKDDLTLPLWFSNEFHKSQLDSMFMTVIKLKCDIRTPCVEDFALQASYKCVDELRQYLYSLLRLDDNDNQSINVYERIGSQMSIIKTEPKLKTRKLNDLPKLTDLRSLSFDERRELFLDIISIDTKSLKVFKELFVCHLNAGDNMTSNDINGAVFMLTVIKYWISKSYHQIWIEFIYSLLTAIIFCGHIGSYNKIRFITLDKTQLFGGIRQFNSKPHHNGAKLFQPRIVHFFNEFQLCLKDIKSINNLFGKPIEIGKPYFCLNGPFIYNLTVELSSRKDPVLYLMQLFGRQSLVTTLFTKLLSTICDDVMDNKFIRCLDVTNRKTHLQSQKLKTRNSKKKVNKGLNNRFSALNIQQN
ncbi:protein asteroid homolog 1-like [Oppia nitens]|uniref:protein asteroid homolog 1-like n=1 Tax=Oppia nitens TaxID=1686743 RepID=UPI0023DB1FB2|nr:protein asteroid homolog 1-like [Oppia nitens]